MRQFLLMRGVRTLLMAAAVLILAGVAPAADENEVDLALVLAVDTSGSVNQIRFELQRRGYAEAFRDRRVLDAVRSGRVQAILVTMTQWTGPETQIQVVPWRRVTDEASALALATEIETTPRRLFGGGTSISGAIDHAVKLIEKAPFRAARRVIDVSGDGSNNRGRPAASARDEAIDLGIAINGLPILELEPYLDRYYRDNVIGGPGAFMIVAQTFEQFGDAVRKKLIQEISSAPRAPVRYAQTRTPRIEK